MDVSQKLKSTHYIQNTQFLRQEHVTWRPRREVGLQQEGGIEFADGQPLSAAKSHLDDLCGVQITPHVHQVSCLALEKRDANSRQGNLSFPHPPPWKQALFQLALVTWSLSSSLQIWTVTAAVGWGWGGRGGVWTRTDGQGERSR